MRCETMMGKNIMLVLVVDGETSPPYCPYADMYSTVRTVAFGTRFDVSERASTARPREITEADTAKKILVSADHDRSRPKV
jgi:hypothetical protein